MFLFSSQSQQKVTKQIQHKYSQMFNTYQKISIQQIRQDLNHLKSNHQLNYFQQMLVKSKNFQFYQNKITLLRIKNCQKEILFTHYGIRIVAEHKLQPNKLLKIINSQNNISSCITPHFQEYFVQEINNFCSTNKIYHLIFRNQEVKSITNALPNNYQTIKDFVFRLLIKISKNLQILHSTNELPKNLQVCDIGYDQKTKQFLLINPIITQLNHNSTLPNQFYPNKSLLSQKSWMKIEKYSSPQELQMQSRLIESEGYQTQQMEYHQDQLVFQSKDDLFHSLLFKLGMIGLQFYFTSNSQSITSNVYTSSRATLKDHSASTISFITNSTDSLFTSRSFSTSKKVNWLSLRNLLEKINEDQRQTNKKLYQILKLLLNRSGMQRRKALKLANQPQANRSYVQNNNFIHKNMQNHYGYKQIPLNYPVFNTNLHINNSQQILYNKPQQIYRQIHPLITNKMQIPYQIQDKYRFQPYIATQPINRNVKINFQKNQIYQSSQNCQITGTINLRKQLQKNYTISRQILLSPKHQPNKSNFSNFTFAPTTKTIQIDDQFIKSYKHFNIQNNNQLTIKSNLSIKQQYLQNKPLNAQIKELYTQNKAINTKTKDLFTQSKDQFTQSKHQSTQSEHLFTQSKQLKSQNRNIFNGQNSNKKQDDQKIQQYIQQLQESLKKSKYIAQKDCSAEQIAQKSQDKCQPISETLISSTQEVRLQRQPILSKCQSSPQYTTKQYPTGSSYHGYMLNNLRHGYGTFHYPQGSYYQGDWLNNKMNGYGKLFYSNNQVAYQGYWQMDQFHGHGKVYNDQPTMLDQTFDFRDFNSLQEQWIYYQGQLSHDLKQGQGKIMLQNGEYFQGLFRNDRINGQGKFVDMYGNVIKGIWKDSQMIHQFHSDQTHNYDQDQ